MRHRQYKPTSADGKFAANPRLFPGHRRRPNVGVLVRPVRPCGSGGRKRFRTAVDTTGYLSAHADTRHGLPVRRGTNVRRFVLDSVGERRVGGAAVRELRHQHRSGSVLEDFNSQPARFLGHDGSDLRHRVARDSRRFAQQIDETIRLDRDDVGARRRAPYRAGARTLEPPAWPHLRGKFVPQSRSHAHVCDHSIHLSLVQGRRRHVGQRGGIYGC